MLALAALETMQPKLNPLDVWIWLVARRRCRTLPLPQLPPLQLSPSQRWLPQPPPPPPPPPPPRSLSSPRLPPPLSYRGVSSRLSPLGVQGGA